MLPRSCPVYVKAATVRGLSDVRALRGDMREDMILIVRIAGRARVDAGLAARHSGRCVCGRQGGRRRHRKARGGAHHSHALGREDLAARVQAGLGAPRVLIFYFGGAHIAPMEPTPKVVILVSVQITLLIASFLVLVYFESQTVLAGNMVNIAGKNRVLASTVNLELGYAGPGGDTQPGRVLAALENFERNLYLLKDGGTSAGIEVPPLPPRFEPEWRVLAERFAAYKGMIVAALPESGAVPPGADVRAMLLLGNEIIELSDGLTTSLGPRHGEDLRGPDPHADTVRGRQRGGAPAYDRPDMEHLQGVRGEAGKGRAAGGSRRACGHPGPRHEEPLGNHTQLHGAAGHVRGASRSRRAGRSQG